ncbi:MAG: FeoB-associated Cys-rich membrane protein [Candidatus Eisenbacteria bacterium]
MGAQDLIVGLVAFGALAWIVRRGWQRRGRSAGCEHCPAAAAGDPPCSRPPAEMLITIDPGPQDSGPSRRS